MVACRVAMMLLAWCVMLNCGKSQPRDAVPADAQAAEPPTGRAAYLIEVPLPLMGTRDLLIEKQIAQLAQKTRAGAQRPLVVLQFTASPTIQTDQPQNGDSRGSQFERGLALARFLTSPAAAKVRLVAYLPRSVEGHAVLPVLACEEIIAASDAELGRAAIDETMLDDTIRGAYRDIVRRRGTIPQAAVEAMLDPNSEVWRVDLADGQSRVVDQAEAKQMRDSGQVTRDESLWLGGGLASYTGLRMRQLRWIPRTADNEQALLAAVDINGRFQSVKLQPETWQAARFVLDQTLTAARVQSLIRAINERMKRGQLNLLVLQLNDIDARSADALELASFISGLDENNITTLAIIEQTCSSPAVLPALACDHVTLLTNASLGSAERQPGAVDKLSPAERELLLELENRSGRPASLMTAIFDPACKVQQYVEQDTGKRRALAQWQYQLLPDRQKWLPRETITSDGVIDTDSAWQYGLIDGQAASVEAALADYGVTDPPLTLESPWLERVIAQILARPWLPRLLIIVAFFTLLIELNSPGLGIGGFISALCFLAFFWIEGLNGNVAWLEILLFVAGMLALAVELFVTPGIGIFGIGGLLLVLSSLVLAGQTFVFPSNSAQLSIIAGNLFWVSMCAFIVMVGFVFLSRRLENTPLMRWVTIEPGGTDDVAELEHREAIVHWEHLLGQDGLTTTRLNPAGKAQFGKQIINVLGTNMIDEGTPVRVVEVRGNSVFVEPLE